LREVFALLQDAGLLPPPENGPHSGAKAEPNKTAHQRRTQQDAEAQQRHAAIAALDRELLEAWSARLAAQGAPQEQLRLLPQVLPYVLRARALDRKLQPHELGRALYHLAQRRGFKSNRKAQPKDDKKQQEEKGMLREISDLGQAIAASGEQATLGKYLSRLNPHEARIRNRHTSRGMYEQEFEAIWQAQAPHHPRILTELFKKKLHRAVFFQRPTKTPKRFIGLCEFEPRRRRAPMALFSAQRFRLLQKVNDLKIIGADRQERELTPEERSRLIQALEAPDLLDQRGRLTFAAARNKVLKLKRGCRFNLERGGEKHLPGNSTAASLARIFGERWQEFSDEERDRIVEDVHSIQKDGALACRGRKVWRLDKEAAETFGKLELEQGYCSLSRQALARLLPLMENRIQYATAVKQVYGEREAPPPTDTLPPLRDTLPGLRNPMVARALRELRKVVNAIVRTYGKPAMIRVELARELKKNAEQREKTWKRSRNLETQRENARRQIIEAPIGIEQPRAGDIEKVMLADECGWHCPYTNEGFGIPDLFGRMPKLEVEHIVPLSRCLDNSFVNKTLCVTRENRMKGQRTPYEAYGGEPDRWAEIIQRVKAFKSGVKKQKL
ncbi:MAG: type II CRISPR RNA-guided endonuclease Cas9, partial [Candidatus Brocadiae bacterium]|nr:type II CRISPR RNA-guided endonuclease Cas9 [Candidatus Brocadiia bacterium]